MEFIPARVAFTTQSAPVVDTEFKESADVLSRAVISCYDAKSLHHNPLTKRPSANR